MEYEGKLYGKANTSYFPLEATTDDFEALQKRVAELEAENKALSQSPVIGSVCTCDQMHPDIVAKTKNCWFCDKPLK